jgi:hypothetical protein
LWRTALRTLLALPDARNRLDARKPAAPPVGRLALAKLGLFSI